MLDVVELTRRFIEIPSITGDERAMAQACAEVLGDVGYRTSLTSVDGERANLLAVFDSPRVLLCSHLDTVPPYFAPRDEGDWLYGRGACDTKGILAAMVLAAARLLADNVRDVGLLFVVGEETDSIGAKHANATLDLPHVAYTIVGEPTESRFARAQKGGLKFTLRARGKAAHSGYPEEGESAVLALLDVLQRVRDADWGEDAVLGCGTANVGVLRAGLRANIVPDAAEAEVFVRIVDSTEATRRRIEQIVAASADAVDWHEDTSNEPQQLTTVPGFPETVVAFNTDVPHLGRFGKPLLMGPGSILAAHAADERISKTELRQAVQQYCDAVMYLRSRTT